MGYNYSEGGMEVTFCTLFYLKASLVKLLTLQCDIQSLNFEIWPVLLVKYFPTCKTEMMILIITISRACCGINKDNVYRRLVGYCAQCIVKVS